MAISYLCIVLAVLKFVNSADRGSSCITPNGESALCISIDDCSIPKETILAGNRSAIEFGKKSQCGYDTAPLVCCATTAYPTPAPVFDDISTKDPPTTKPPVRKEPIGLISTTSSTLLPNNTICGLEAAWERLFGGMVSRYESPWMALIGYKDSKDNHVGFKCGGTLINNRYVLTAAQCIVSYSEWSLYNVRLGEWDLNSEPDCVEGALLVDCNDPVVDIRIKQNISHPYFNSRNGNHDIGLLLLERDVKYTDFIRPICLPTNDIPAPPEGTLMTAYGWRATEDGSQSNLKLKIQMPLVSNSECIKRFSSRKIFSIQACAGGVESEDVCQGATGGPLMRTYTGDPSSWYQEGVVPSGLGCGRKGYPAVYTRVSPYVNWIMKNIAGSDRES